MYFRSEESIRICPPSASSSFSRLSSMGSRFSFPAMPVPFIRSSRVSYFPCSCGLKRLTHSASFTPRSFITSQLSGEMSMAFTSKPRSCNTKAWQPAPAPMSSTLPLAMLRAFCSSRGIWLNVRKRWATGISSSSNIDESTLRCEALPLL